MKRPSAVRAMLMLARFELTDLVRHPAPILMRCLTLPVYAVALTALWNGLRKGVGGFPTLAYFLFTQTILDSFLNRFEIASLTLGFEPALSRPLSWQAQGAAQAFGRTAGQLLVIGALVQAFLALADPAYRPTAAITALRWLLVLPLLALADAFATEVMAGLYLRIGKSDSLRFVVTKCLLALGGGLYPLLGEGYRGIGWLRMLPFSDFVFQPVYFCLYGHAYGMDTAQWLLRLACWMILLALAVRVSFRLAWSGLQVSGG